MPTVFVENSLMIGSTGSGSVPPQSAECAPSPSNVSVAKPSHCSAGSNTSFGTASPAHTPALRRSVLSAVDTSPVPHSVPGSLPTWPNESTTTSARRSTMASSPLYQPAPLVRSATARIAAAADDCATT